MKGFTRDVPGDPELRRGTANWASEIESYIEGDPDAMKVAARFADGHHPDLAGMVSATGLDFATVSLIVSRLQNSGVIGRLSDGSYGTTVQGGAFIENRSYRWKRRIEETPIRARLASKTVEEMRVELGAVRLALQFGTLTDTETHEHDVLARVLGDLIRKGERRQAG